MSPDVLSALPEDWVPVLARGLGLAQLPMGVAAIALLAEAAGALVSG